MGSRKNYGWVFLGLLIISGCLLPDQSLAQIQEGTTSAVETGGPFRGGWWVKTEWGADYALMGDVISGMKAWQAVFQSAGISSTLSVSNWGWQGQFEAGLNLDQDNALSIEIHQIYCPTESITRGLGSGNYTYSVAPTLDDVTLNYYRTLFKGGGFRTYAVIGGGYYHTDVNYYGGTGGLANGESATFTGDILGGSLGIGEEMQISRNVSLGLDFKGLLAAFGQVTSNSLNGYGQVTSAHAPYALGISNAPGYDPIRGTIIDYSVPFAGQDLRYAVVDFSGFTTNLSLVYHF
jgi:hypothetical protein